MSFVAATTELVRGAAQDLSGIGTALTEAAASVSGPTTGIAAAAEDEISIAISSLFGSFGRQFQMVSTQAQAFHTEFVNLLNSSAGAYSRAEIANAAAASGLDPVTRVQQVLAGTTQNAQRVFGAWDAGVTTLVSGVSTGFNQLLTNPTGFFGKLPAVVQSVHLVGAPHELSAAVVQHTLGGITQSSGSETVDVSNVHVQLYQGLMEGFLENGSEGALFAGALNFAASPLSGLLVGAVGPFISPGVALLNSVNGVFADITGGNATGAFHGLINTPANVVDGFFNGAVLNLDPLAPVVNQLFAGPGAEEQVVGMSFGFGGLFSPGQVVYGAAGPRYDGVGGSLLNSLGLQLAVESDDFVGTLPVPALPVGPIAAAANLFSIVGQALGPGLPLPPAVEM